MAPRYVAAFRTYIWDDGTAEMARRFFSATNGARQVILADETRGPLHISGYEVLSHTDDTRALGLPREPADGSLWFNGDYGLYILRDALPDYDFYMTCESDLAVNICLLPMVRFASENQIGLIAHEVKLSTPDWHWHNNGTSLFNPSWRSLIFFMLVSAPAVDTLYNARKVLAGKFYTGLLKQWPFCESFVPSVLKQANMRFEEVSTFAGTENLRYRPRIPMGDERANVPNSLAHSVLSNQAYIKAVISDYGAMDWFAADSQLRQALKTCNVDDYATLIKNSFANDLNHAAYQEFTNQMRVLGLETSAPADLAFCKPAASSSTSQWSHFSDTQKDASGANSLADADDFGFHTALENEPWWMVDLLKECVVDKVSISNRVTFSERFRSFRIEGSRSGTTWNTRYIKLDLSEITSDTREPFEVVFADPFVARYVRIKSLSAGMLHLRRVRIFGRGIC